MSANAEVLGRSALIGSSERGTVLPRAGAFGETKDWNPEDFARE